MITRDNIHNYYSEIEEYIQNKMGFSDNSVIDTIDIDGDNLIIHGVFRETEPDNWEEYELAGFPDDIDSIVIEFSKLEDYINNF